MLMRNFEQLRYAMLNQAIRKNVIREPKWRSRINLGFLAWANLQATRHAVAPTIFRQASYEHPELDPLTQRYWESTRGLLDAPAGIVPWVVELARISVQDGQIGICKSLEQVVIHPDLQSPSYYSTISSWGNPFVIPTTVGVTWHLRLERCDQGEPAWINASSPTPAILLPGEPHFDLPQITDLWFPAASPSGQNIHLCIGSRYRLRVIAVVTRTEEFALSVSAKIRGFSQGVYSPYTLRSLRYW